MRGSTRGPDISRFLSDVPMDINAFDYYAQTLDKTVPIMDVGTDKGFAVTTTERLDTWFELTLQLLENSCRINVAIAVREQSLGLRVRNWTVHDLREGPLLKVLSHQRRETGMGG